MKSTQTKYKTTNIPWLPKLPEHWTLSRVKNHFLFPKNVAGENFNDYKVLSLSINGVVIRDMDSGKGKYSQSMDTYQIVSPNSIILCLFDMDVTPRIVGYCNDKGIITSAYTVITPKKDISSKFYYYYFLTLDYNKSLFAQGTGVRATLTDWQFGSLALPLPSYTEQNAIANYLDGQNEKINLFIANKQKLIALLKEQKQAIINELLKNADGIWERKKLKYFIKHISIQTTIKSEDEIYLGMENVESKTGKFVETEVKDFESQAKKFSKGQILFGKLRPYLAKVFLAPFNGVCSGEFLVFQPNKNILPEFLQLILLSNFFISLVDSSTFGTKMPRAEWSFIGNVFISVPSINTQQQIINHIKEETAKIDEVIIRTEKEIELIKEYRQSIIAEVVTGKIKVAN